jgi:hypothetical protein
VILLAGTVAMSAVSCGEIAVVEAVAATTCLAKLVTGPPKQHRPGVPGDLRSGFSECQRVGIEPPVVLEMTARGDYILGTRRGPRARLAVKANWVRRTNSFLQD